MKIHTHRSDLIAKKYKSCCQSLVIKQKHINKFVNGHSCAFVFVFVPIWMSFVFASILMISNPPKRFVVDSCRCIDSSISILNLRVWYSNRKTSIQCRENKILYKFWFLCSNFGQILASGGFWEPDFDFSTRVLRARFQFLTRVFRSRFQFLTKVFRSRFQISEKGFQRSIFLFECRFRTAFWWILLPNHDFWSKFRL